MVETTAATPPFLAGKKVIIAGAGLAGLTFAVSLSQQWNSLYSPTSKTTDPTILTPPKIILYERNPKPSATDNDGYGLSIRSDPLSGGMQVLQKLNLLESALRISLGGSIAVPPPKSTDSPSTTSSTGNTSSSGSGGFNIWDKNWKTLIKFQPKISDPSIPVPAIRISRKLLRQLLIDALASEDIIQWGVSCIDAETVNSADGTVHVQVSLGSSTKGNSNADVNATTDTCDLLIAADGAHSLLRNSLCLENKLSFAGAISISGRASFASSSSSEQSLPAVLRNNWGTMIGIGGGVSLFAAPVDEYSAIWSLSYLASSERARGPVRSKTGAADDRKPGEAQGDDMGEEWQEALKHEALTLGHSIAPPFQTLINASPTATIWLKNARDLTPFSHTTVTPKSRTTTTNTTTNGKNITPTPTEQHRVIFIGDSNHAMSSFAGNGANMALMDGWDLAGELCGCVVPSLPPPPPPPPPSSSPSSPPLKSQLAQRDAERAALRKALKAYDALSMPRSEKAIRMSRWTIAVAHAEGWRLWVWVGVLRVLRLVFFRRGGGEGG